jgi:hypothetical protein
MNSHLVFSILFFSFLRRFFLLLSLDSRWKCWSMTMQYVIHLSLSWCMRVTMLTFSLCFAHRFFFTTWALIYIHVIGNKVLTNAHLTYRSACWQRKKNRTWNNNEIMIALIIKKIYIFAWHDTYLKGDLPER